MVFTDGDYWRRGDVTRETARVDVVATDASTPQDLAMRVDVRCRCGWRFRQISAAYRPPFYSPAEVAAVKASAARGSINPAELATYTRRDAAKEHVDPVRDGGDLDRVRLATGLLPIERLGRR